MSRLNGVARAAAVALALAASSAEARITKVEITTSEAFEETTTELISVESIGHAVTACPFLAYDGTKEAEAPEAVVEEWTIVIGL